MTRVDENETNSMGTKDPRPAETLRTLVPRWERTLFVTHESVILGFQLVTAESEGIKPTLLVFQKTIADGFDTLHGSLFGPEPVFTGTLGCGGSAF